MQPSGVINVWRSLLEDESGQDLVEYGLILLLVSVGSIAAVARLAHLLVEMYSSISGNIPTL